MDITIVLPVSRDHHLRQIFTNLEFLECDPEHTNLLVYVDGDQKLYEAARNFTVMSRFKQRLCLFRSRGLPNISSLHRRRQRIADIHNELKGIIKQCDYIFMLEDDTLFPYNTLQKLIRWYSIYPYAGFISAAELGRWGLAYIGGWKVNDPYTVTHIESIKNSEEMREVDAAGFYCQLVPYKNYMLHNFKPYEDLLGPDFNYGIELRRAGYKNYMDVSIKCRHITQTEEITFMNSEIVQLKYDREGTKWKQGIHYNMNI